MSPIAHNHHVAFNGELMPQNEVAIILLSSSQAKTELEKQNEVFGWFERRLKVGRFTPKS